MTITIRAKTAAGAARETHRALLKVADRYGYTTDGIALWDPERSEQAGFGRCWSICWEEGPFEWGTSLSMGDSMFAASCGYGNPPEINLFGDAGWHTEPYWSFSLCFFGDK